MSRSNLGFAWIPVVFTAWLPTFFLGACTAWPTEKEGDVAQISPASVQQIDEELERQARILAKRRRQIDKQEEELARQAEEIGRQRAQIDRQKIELERLKRPRRSGGDTLRHAVMVPAVVRGLPPARDSEALLAQEQPVPRAPRPPTENKPAVRPPVAPREEPPSSTEQRTAEASTEKPQDELLLESGAVLLRKGSLQIEPSLSYTHASSDRVNISGLTIFEAIVIGTIRVDTLQRNTLTAEISADYGMTDRWQVGMSLPYVYRRDEEVLGVGTPEARDRTIDGYGIGDFSVSTSYQPVVQRGGIPGIILRLGGKFPTGRHPFEIPTETIGAGGQTRLTDAPTGGGFYSATPGVTFVWRSDPVAFFTGGSYTINFEREFNRAGKIDPGDTVEIFGGVNLALSDRVGLNFSFVDQITNSSEQNGMEAPGTSANDARLSIGASIGLRPNTSLLVAGTVGVTDQSPDFQFTVSLPITLDFH